MGAEPTAVAWVSCLLIFLFAGPLGVCLMWLPFALDGCYKVQGADPRVGQEMRQHRTATMHVYGMQQPRAGGPVIAVAVAQPPQRPIQAVAVPMEAVASPSDGTGGFGVAVTATPLDNPWQTSVGGNPPVVEGVAVRAP